MSQEGSSGGLMVNMMLLMVMVVLMEVVDGLEASSNARLSEKMWVVEEVKLTQVEVEPSYI